MAEVTPESVGLKSNRNPLEENLDGRSNVRPVQEQYTRLFRDPTISGSATLGRGETLDTQSINLNKEIPIVNTKNLNLQGNVSGGAWSTTTKENDAPIFNEKGQQVGFSLGGKLILDAPSSAFFWGNISKDFSKTKMEEITPAGNLKGNDNKTYTVWDAGLELGRFGINLGEKSVVLKIGQNGKLYLSPDNKGTVGFKFGKDFNKGGTPMMEKQMEMFEDGGLKDEGGMVDEQSGNKVPVGSNRKEVRDDIPAQLSEGEFVFPADVVRFIGLEKLMKLRQQAKMGLKKMEDMGQMGNSDEAILPDDLPFDETDLLIVQDGKPMQMAKGGILTAADGTDVRKLPIQQSARKQVEAAGYSFDDLFGSGPGGMQTSFRTYKNEDGVSITIRFVGNSNLDPIPEGYYPVDGEGNIIKPDDPEAGETPEEPVETEEERIKRRQYEGGPDNPDAGQVKSLDQMGLKDIIALNKTIQTLDESGGIMGKVIAGLLNKDKVAKRAELAEKQMDPMQDKKVIEAINKQKQEKEKEGDGSSSTPSISSNTYSFEGDSGMGGAISAAGGGDDFGTPPGGNPTNTGGGSGVSANVSDNDFDFGMGGPDGPGNFGGDSGPTFGVDGFSMNKGGLAGVKPKKKMKTYKKGGLATR
jgi:hypothetical protein